MISSCLAAVLLAAAPASPRLEAWQARSEAQILLDRYAAGNVDGAVEPLATRTPEQIRAFRQQLVADGQLWVDAGAADRSRRILIAAAFALEAERLLAERNLWAIATQDQPCNGACVLEWACTLLRSRPEPDAFERLWAEATIALAGGIRAWTFLHSPLTPPARRTVVRGHVLHLLERFPDAARVRLARAVALSSRYMVTTELDTPREGVRAWPAPRATIEVVLDPSAGSFLEERRRAQLDYARLALLELRSDPDIGPEAMVRLAQMHMREDAFEDALAEAQAALAAASDDGVRYVAAILAAQASQAIGDLTGAEARYRDALEVRPHSQSATLGLAALLHLRGAADPAFDHIAAMLSHRTQDDDPWRLFLYGDFPRLPRLVTGLRQEIGR